MTALRVLRGRRAGTGVLLAAALGWSPVHATPAQAGDAAQAPRLVPAPCPTGALVDRGAACYSLYVRENRDAPSGRVLRLPVAVLDRSPPGRDARLPPVVFFPGGPGSSPLDRPAQLDQLLAETGDRPLVVFDGRGFANAEPALHCTGWGEASPWYNAFPAALVEPGSLDERIARQARVVEECHRTLLERGIDVGRYNEYEMARDVADLVELLGYPRVVAYGTSTGGGSALSFVRYAPERVTAAVLVVPWHPSLRNRAPIEEYYAARQAITDVVVACTSGNARCRAALPSPLLAIERTRRALDARPFRVRASDGTELSFDGAAFLHALYTRLPDVQRELPEVLRRVPAGDRSVLRAFFDVDGYGSDRAPSGYAWGYYFAHACGDAGRDKPSREDSLAMLRREPALLGFEPNVFCGWWDTIAPVPAQHSDPLHSTIPVLSLHGQLDPCCGRRWGEYLARTMPRVQVVEFAGHGHSLPASCRAHLVRRFLADPGATVDAACASDTRLQWTIP